MPTRLEMLGCADPRKLQDMRRADGTGGEDHLALGIGPLDRAAARVLDRRRRGVPSKTMRLTSALMTSWRLGRFSAGRR